MALLNNTSKTMTALKRWSCVDKQLPSVEDIKAIHVYDFDNTLFCSPLPNKQVWNNSSLGTLQTMEVLSTGGWWHDSNILASTGKGIEEEEPRAWEGNWNESIVELARLSIKRAGTLSILLTGRKDKLFSDIIQRMAKAKNLDFDMFCLKPEVGPFNQRFSSTMAYKQELLRDFVLTCNQAEEIKMYEDRPKHTKGFRDFFTDLNRSLLVSNERAPISAEVIQVTEQSASLDPVTEVAEVQRMINAHNSAVAAGTASHGSNSLTIKRSVFYTGYLISPADSSRLSALVPASAKSDELRHLANNILIVPRPCPPQILSQVGGMGKKVGWKVTGVGNYDNRLFAARVAPLNPSESIYTENKTPSIVLALHKSARPVDATRIKQWTPISQSIEFETVVGEKVLLSIEREDGRDTRQNNNNTSIGFKRQRDDDFPPLGSNRPNGRFEDKRGGHGRGGGGNNRDRGRGGGGGGGGRRGGFRPNRGQNSHRGGRRGGYRSLDDAGAGYTGPGGGDGMQY